MEADLKRKQASLEQMDALLEYLKEHQELAKGLTRGRRGKLHTLKLWNSCAKKLNEYKEGAVKDGKGWSKYWCDWKYRVRRRALELKAAQDANRPLPDGNTALSPMEEIILSIIGENALDGVIIKADPLGEEETLEDFTVENHNNISSFNQYPGMKNNICTSSPQSDENCLVRLRSAQSEGFKQNSKPNVSVPEKRATRPKKRRLSTRDTSELADGDCAPSHYTPPERKTRANARNEGDSDANETEQFLQLERQRLDTSRSIRDSLKTIASELTRLTNVISDIKDVLINR